MRSRWAISMLVLVVLLATAVPALAANAEEVADAASDTGVYVEPGSSADDGRVGDLVSAIRSEGERVVFVVLAAEPIGGATTFADAVYDRFDEGVVVVVAPETVGWSGTTEVFTVDEFDAAVDASLDGGSDAEVLELFTETLVGGSVPAPSGSAAADSDSTSGGGGGSVWIWLIVIAVGAGLFLFWRSRQSATRGPRLDPGLAEAKQAVQRQIDALANDIIDMEDEIRAADNEQADGHYEKAGITYGEVTDAFAAADTPEAVLDLSNRLDVAIWQLDCAEAILDGQPPPPRPEPNRLPAPEPAARPTVPHPTSGGSSTLPPRPDYSRRPGRRSSPMGGGLLEVLMGMAGGMMVGRSRGGFGGMLGGADRGRRVPPPQFPRVPTRSRSPVPGPSRSGGSRSSSRSSRSGGRSGTGRGRGGGRRRGG